MSWNKSTDPLALEAIELQTGPDPVASVIWLHGLGADGHDFAPLVDELDLQSVGDIRFIFPHAPMRPVTINRGFVMRAWYDILSLELDRVEDEAGIRASAQAIDALIEREIHRGVPRGRIVLGGFSQGCAMSLHVGLRMPEPIAGIAGLSGYLPLVSQLPAEIAPNTAPLFLAHGTVDNVVSLQRAEASYRVLQQLGLAYEWRTYPMAHSVHPQEIQHLADFLRRCLS